MLFSISKSVSDDRRTSTTLRKNQADSQMFLMLPNDTCTYEVRFHMLAEELRNQNL